MTAVGNRLLSADDSDRVKACADLVGRSGATKFEIGYLHDGVPADKAGWWGHAAYRGTRLTVSDLPGPAEVAHQLAVKILTGAKCRCGALVALSDEGAVFLPDSTMADGSKWTLAEAEAAGQCRWRRVGARWEPSCPEPAGRS